MRMIKIHWLGIGLLVMYNIGVDPLWAEVRPLDQDVLSRWTFKRSGTDSEETVAAADVDAARAPSNGVFLDAGHPTLPLDDVEETTLAGPFSVSAWIKPDMVFSEPAGGSAAVALAEDAPLSFGMVGNRLRLTLRDREGQPVVLETAGEMEPGRWNLVTLVADGDNFRVYLDHTVQLVGRVPAIDASAETAPGAGDESTELRLKDVIPQVQSTGGFSGMVDDVTVFKRALTDEDVQDMSASEPQGFVPDGEAGKNDKSGVDPVVVVSVFVLIILVGVGLIMGQRR